MTAVDGPGVRVDRASSCAVSLRHGLFADPESGVHTSADRQVEAHHTHGRHVEPKADAADETREAV